MSNEHEEEPAKQVSSEQLDKTMEQLRLMLHYNLEYAKNRRTGKTSKLEAELRAELDTLKKKNELDDEETLKRLTAARHKRLNQKEPEE